MDVAVSQISKLHPKVVRYKRELRNLLERFESGQDRSLSIQQRLQASTQTLDDDIHHLQVLLGQAENSLEPAARSLWERRVATLRADSDWIRNAVTAHLGDIHQIRKNECERRKRLLETSANHTDTAPGAATMESMMAKERYSLRESADLLMSMLHQGQGIVSNLVGQNITLKGAQRKILDFQNTLGVSTSLVGTIQRRHGVDRLLVYFGMILTVTVFVTCYYFVHVRYSGVKSQVT